MKVKDFINLIENHPGYPDILWNEIVIETPLDSFQIGDIEIDGKLLVISVLECEE